ncbi:MAG TPA: S8 family serine peptidase [Solirubrobacteraceae bacterium]|nr:S8 family serine peptidase [Solirubrobacteraceae bacterium]
MRNAALALPAAIACTLVAALGAAPATAAHEPEIAVIVHVRQSSAMPRAARSGRLAVLLRRRAQRDQAALLRMLRAAASRGEARAVQSLWIDDSIAVRAQPELLARLRQRRDVRAIEPDRPLLIERAAPAAAVAAIPSAAVTATGAPALWAQGQTGRGVVVAVLDTGLIPGFPQLATTPGSWFDPYDQHMTPIDEDSGGHGTEVAEVVTTMAPDVRIMAARVFSDGGRSTTSAVHRVFEWVLDPDGNPKTDDAPSVINGSWDDGQPGHCETEFDADIAVLRAAGIVPVFAAGNAGPAAATGASPASAPGAVAVGSVSGVDTVSPFSGRGPSPCGGAFYPTLAAYGEAVSIDGPGGSAVVSGTSFAAPQVAGAAALLAGMFPGATPDSIVDALVRGARDVGTPGADPDTGAGILNVPQAAALLAGADHAGPRVTIAARWSRDSSHPGLVVFGRAHERGGGTGTDVTAEAFIGVRGVPAAPIALTSEPAGATDARLAGLIVPRQVRRLEDGRHSLFVRARDAAGNWGPVRSVVLPVDRQAPTLRASGVRRGGVVATTLFVHERGSGLVLLRYRVEVGGAAGRWRSLGTASRIRLRLHVTRGRRAILRVLAEDVAGNESRSGFAIPR